MISQLLQRLFGSIRRQLVLGLGLILALTMSLFVLETVRRQQSLLLEQQRGQTLALAQSVAASTAVWVASSDLVGLQEIIDGLRSYPDLSHAIVLDSQGRVLAHNEPAHRGEYLTDLPREASPSILADNDNLIDVANPVMIAGHLSGWVRIGLTRASLKARLATIRRDGLLYGMLAITLGALITTFSSRYLTRRLYAIQRVADAVREGRSDARVAVGGHDEAAQLGRQFNEMLDDLARQDAQIRAFYELDLVGLAITSPQKGWIRINKCLCRMLEYSEQELRRMTWAELTYPDDLAADVAQFTRLLNNEIQGYSLDKRFLSRTGGIVPTELVVRAIRKANGDIDYVVAMVKDISERKQAERELLSAQERALRAEADARALEQSKRMFENSPDAYLIMATDGGTVLDCNHAAEVMLGGTRDQIIRMTPDQLSPPVQPDGKPSIEAVAVKIEESLRQQGHRFEWVHRRFDGSDFWAEVTISVTAYLGQTVLFVAWRDISDSKQAELALRSAMQDISAQAQALQQRTAELEVANKDLESFSYSISHDLRAPLRAIDGFIAILQEDYAEHLDAEGQRLFGIVSANARKMGHLIDDILALSRAGRLELAPTPVDMNVLVAEVWDSLAEQRGERAIAFQPGELPTVWGDPRALRQVWQNLLGNAIKFTRDRQPARIEVSAERQDDLIWFSVKDNGAGFRRAYQDKLFGLFQRLHGVEEFEGTGVGLAIVKRFIDRHGGQVQAEGEVGAGATFRFGLPANPDQRLS